MTNQLLNSKKETYLSNSLLRNKSVLFFCYPFRGYNKFIIDSLEEMGAQVTYYSDSPDYKLFRIMPSVIKNYVIKKYDKYILDKIRNNKYDYIFVIKGTYISNAFLKELKILNPNGKFLLYLWDSLKNYDYSNKISSFDKVFSFDRNDCKQLNTVTYLPLFFIPQFNDKQSNFEKSNDLFFIGGGLSYRKPFLERLVKNINDPEIKCLFYFPSLKYYLKSLFLKDPYFIFLRKPIPHEKFIKEFLSSKAIVDIPSPNQTGLTMRTLEVLGSGIKLITTNESIVQEPFYDDNNILVISCDNPIVPKDFLNCKSSKIDMSDYSLKSFLNKIFLSV